MSWSFQKSKSTPLDIIDALSNQKAAQSALNEPEEGMREYAFDIISQSMGAWPPDKLATVNAWGSQSTDSDGHVIATIHLDIATAAA